MPVGLNHSHDIDVYADLKSPIHQWDGRFKIVGLLAIIFAFASVKQIQSLPILIAITVLIYSLSNLPWRLIWRRLLIPGYVVTAIVIFLPFVSGETVLAHIGPFQLRQEGLYLALLIAGRLFCIVILAFVVFGTDSFIRTIGALRALRLPDIMADMLLLTYRYLYEISAFFNQMQTSARIRGFQGKQFSFKNIGTLASLIGHLFIRSYEKSERVYKAMVLRGYGTVNAQQAQFKSVTFDYLKTALCVFIAVLLLVWDRLI